MYDIEANTHPNHRLNLRKPVIAPKLCRARGKAFTGGHAGKILDGLIELYDDEGCRMYDSDIVLHVELSLCENIFSDSPKFIYGDVQISDNGDGTFCISYIAQIANTWTLSITTDDFQHIDGSPFSVIIDAGDVSPYKSELKEIQQIDYISNYKEFLIYSRDSFGNVYNRGDVDYKVSCLGTGKVTAVENCRNGSHRIICYINDDALYTKLRVTLYGKDVLNSPFVLRDVPPKLSNAVAEGKNPLVENIRKCRELFLKNNTLKQNYLNTRNTFVKHQDATMTVYNASFLRVVHSIPVVFNIDEVDPDIHVKKRNEVRERYAKLMSDVERLNTLIKEAEDKRQEIVSFLTEKSILSNKAYYDAITEYNNISSIITKLSANTKSVQRFRRKIKEGNLEVLRELDEKVALEESLSLLRESNGLDLDRLKSGDHKFHIMSGIDKSYERSTIPDKPNTLAFWLLEGRFKPK